MVQHQKSNEDVFTNVLLTNLTAYIYINSHVHIYLYEEQQENEITQVNGTAYFYLLTDS